MRGESKEKKKGKNLHPALGPFFATRPLIGVGIIQKTLHLNLARVMTRRKPVIGVYKMKMKQKKNLTYDPRDVAHLLVIFDVPRDV